MLFSILLLNGCSLQEKGTYSKELIELLYAGLSISFVVTVLAALTLTWSGSSDVAVRSGITAGLFAIVTLLIFVVA